MTITLKADRPLALLSPDHLHPLGTRLDNSVRVEFNTQLRAYRGGHPSLLDLGCAGGGLVKSLLDDGHLAVGIEGSDYSQLRHRAEWATIPNNLFTADVTAPFQLYQDGVPLRFDFVTAWEFLEHITQDDLPAVFENIDRHLAPEGLFLASVNTWGSLFDGIDLHQTIQPVEWWNDEFTRLGWRRNVEAEKHFETTWLRQDSGDFHVALERSRS